MALLDLAPREFLQRAVAKFPTQNLRQAVAEIPWGHNLLIMNKTDNDTTATFYIQATAEYGWSRNVLLNQIKANAYQRSLSENKQP